MTTAFDVKSALRDTLAANVPASYPDAVVSYANEPPAGAVPRIQVWLSEIQWDYTDSKSLGNSRFEESYRIMMIIEVARPGDTQEDANGVAKQIYNDIQELLRVTRANPTPLGFPLQRVEVSPLALGEGQATSITARKAVFVCQVHVVARI